MQCFVDTWATILDDRNKPLVGKIGFYEPNTTTLKNIFGTDEVIPLDNPIYCNGVTTSQVLLDEGDYTARYWRYIGNGNMESDDNEESWFLYKTELIKDGSVVRTDFTGNGIVDTIDELKDLTGMEDGDIVLVHGYYTNDDCPARYFVWHENGSYEDDGGVCIKSNGQNTGAWIMKIPGTYIDVRWFGDIPSNTWSGTSSNLGQRAKAAIAANKYSKDLYFPAYNKGTQNGFYVFNGSNTVSVNQKIICDDRVRFVVKHGTSGTLVSCSEFVKDGRYLFVSEQGEQIGGYELHADWIKTSWLNSNTSSALNWARQGFIIDEMQSPLTLENVKLKVEQSPMSGTTLINCEMLECNKKINNNITIQNMEIDTDWFDDDYDWSKLTISGCNILLNNCKDANTYILLKNKQNESDYGDLGEQQINASVLAGGTIENCYGSITALSHGVFEIHNATLTCNGFNTSDSLNLVDTWLTFNGGNVTLNSIMLRRGNLNGDLIQVLNDSLIDNADVYAQINCRGTNTEIRNSKLYGLSTGTNLTLTNNDIYATVEQLDDNGTININCVGNMFHKYNGTEARHYVRSTLAEGVVKGIWANNGSSYDTVHWIRLDRTYLKSEDSDHQYSYMNNSEPYLSKWNGVNHPMKFRRYGGSRDPQDGEGVWNTTNIPFLFMNYRTRLITAVNRYLYWKMFTVGKLNPRRVGRIGSGPWLQGPAEGASHDGKVGIVWSWGCDFVSDTENNGQLYGMKCVSLDGDGEADYKFSFEAIDEDHTRTASPYGTSQGVVVGFYPSSEWGEAHVDQNWIRYDSPITPTYARLCVLIEPNFCSYQNEQS